MSREGDELKDGFTSGMHRDLGVYLPAMEKQLVILDDLYEEYNLESDEVVWNLDTLTERIPLWGGSMTLEAKQWLTAEGDSRCQGASRVQIM